MTSTVFYPGSFDPITNGHLDIINRSAALFDKVVIGVGVHHGKKPLFDGEERLSLLDRVISTLEDDVRGRVTVTSFDDLAVSAARRAGADAIVRGLRDSADFRYEMQMAGMNSAMDVGLETVFLAASPRVRHVAATFVRQIAAMGGDVSVFVPPVVAAALAEKFGS